jgi:hypothetical protein
MELTPMQLLYNKVKEKELSKIETLDLIKEFMFEERKELEYAYEVGVDDYANLNYFAESGQDYYNQKFDKFFINRI